MTALLALLVASPAAWALPDRVAATLTDASSSDVERLAVFEDHAVAVVIAGDNSLRLIDTDTWETDAVSACDNPTSVTGYTDASSSELTLIVGCASGAVQPVYVDATHAVTLGTEEDLGYGAIKDLTAYSADELWVAVDGVDVYQVATSDYTQGVTSNLNQTGLVELLGLGGYVLALHSSDVSRIDANTGNAALSVENIGSRTFADMATWSASGVYLADSNQGGVIRYQLTASTDEFQILLDDEDGLTGVSALTIDVSDADDAWLAVADESQDVLLFEFSTDSGAVGDVVLSEVDVSSWGGLTQLEAVDGYLIGGGSGGDVVVLTDRPWVSVTSSAGSSTLESGDAVTLSISSDMGGDWSLRQGGYDGAELASGSFDADEVAEVELSVDGSYDEGRNRLVVRVTDGFLEGRAGATLTVDNPPPAVSGFELGVGRESLLVSFDGVDIADLDHYELYVSGRSFSAADYDEGGPSFTSGDGVSYPISLSGYSAGEGVSATISGLTNGQTYYVGVRAVDTNGTEGSMSDVLSASPTEAYGAAGLAGDEGGFGCSTGPGAGGPLGLLGLVGAALLGRRRRVGVLGLGLAALIATPAHADDDGRVKGHRDDDGKVVVDRTGEIRVGGTSLGDANIETVYGSEALRSLDLEMGVQVFRVLEFDAGIGLVRDTGNLYSTSSGGVIAEEAKLSLVPLSLAGTLRLDLFDGMPIVPYGSFGLDYWLYRERLGEIDVTELFQQETVMGDRVGYHYAVGANVLLDWADPKHASLARARWGIHDTYVTMDLTWNRMLEDYGLSFDSRAITVGLKFDH